MMTCQYLYGQRLSQQFKYLMTQWFELGSKALDNNEDEKQNGYKGTKVFNYKVKKINSKKYLYRFDNFQSYYQ